MGFGTIYGLRYRVDSALQRFLYANRDRLRGWFTRAPTVMFDSVDVNQIPANARAVVGYVDGRYANILQVIARFPRAKRLPIAVFAKDDAEALDIEREDATISEAPAWVKRQQARGIRRPVVYTSVSQAQMLLDALRREGIVRDQVRLWSAHYTYVEHLCGPHCGFGLTTTADATQWTDKALGRNLDQSLLSPDFFA